MTSTNLFVLPVSAVAVFAMFAAAYADDHKDKLIFYKLLTMITIPGGLTGFE